MATKAALVLWLLSLLLAVPARAQSRPDSLAADSTAAASRPAVAADSATLAPAPGATPAPDPAAEQGPDPGLFVGIVLLAVVVITAVLLGIGAGLLLALLAVVLAAGLLATGILTSAALVGLWQRSWWAGLRVLLWLLALLGGAAAGAALAEGVHFIANDTFTAHALAVGAGGGLLLGGLAAYTCQRLVGLALAAARRRWPALLPDAR